MVSVGDVEIFIPDHSHIITLPVGSLPPPIIRKLVVSPGVSERPATFIGPVEVREKGATPGPRPLTPGPRPLTPGPRPLTPGPRPLTPGPIRLPVVTSNSRAMETLRKFLRGGEISPCCSAETSCSSFSRRKNSIILFNSNIFLIQPKAKRSDWLHQRPNSAPLQPEAPPTNTQNDDITGGSKDGAGAAEDHGKCTLQETDAAVTEEKQEVLLKDASTNTVRIKLERAELVSQQGRTNHMTPASANQITTSKSPGGEAASRKRTQTNAKQSPVQNEVKGRIRDPEIRDVNADGPETAKENAEKAASYVKVQSRGGQSSFCESGVEVVDVTDGDNDKNSRRKDGDVARESPVDCAVKTCERIQYTVNRHVTPRHSVIKRKTDQDVAMETNARREDPIAAVNPNGAEPGTGFHKVGGASAKRHKPEVEVASSVEGKCSKYVDPNSEVQNDVRIIEVNEEEEEEEEEVMMVLVNEGNCGISELPEEHHVSRSDGSEAEAVPEDLSAPRNQSEQKDVLMKVPPGSSVGERLWSEREVLTAKPRPYDQVLRKRSREPERCGAEGPVDGDIGEELNKEAAASSAEKISSGSCLESHDGCEPADGVGPSEHSEFTAPPSGATNQSAHREDASPRPTSSSGKREMEYVVLNREENINLMREKIRRIQEEISNLDSSKH